MDRTCRRSDEENGLMCWNIICSIGFVKCCGCEASYSMIHVFVPLTVRPGPSSYLTRLEENWQPRQVFHHMIALYDARGSIFQRMKPSRRSTIVVPKPFLSFVALKSSVQGNGTQAAGMNSAPSYHHHLPVTYFHLGRGLETVMPLYLTLVDGQGNPINLGVARGNCLAPRHDRRESLTKRTR
jgi:hypothetical protein